MYCIRYIFSIVAIGFFGNPMHSIAQCRLTALTAVSYQKGNCGNFEFQSLTGSLNAVFGQCGNLVFSPPLSGGDVITMTRDEAEIPAIILYPNPAIEGLNIEIRGIKYPVLKLKNSLGIVVALPLPDAYMDIDYLLPGMYLLEVYSTENRLVLIKKIIKL